MATGRVYNEIFLEHGESWHVENRRRLEVVLSSLQQDGLWDRLEELDTYPAEREQLLWLHTEEYLEELQALSAAGGGSLDPDTVANWATWAAATVAAGSCVAAAEDIIEGGVDNAFCFVRPPGHHAGADRGSGFCFLNNVALAAEAAIRHDLQRVAIVDFDVHHGNGTQELFYHRGDVLYASIHQWGIHPGTGTVDEVGVDQGSGRTINIPLPRGAQDRHYLRALKEIILPALRRFEPQFLLVSAGYDGAAGDPLAHHLLTPDLYYRFTAELSQFAEQACEGRLCAVLEGGYELQALAQGVRNTVLALLGDPAPEPSLPAPPAHPEATARVEDHLDQIIEIHRTRLAL